VGSVVAGLASAGHRPIDLKFIVGDPLATVHGFNVLAVLVPGRAHFLRLIPDDSDRFAEFWRYAPAITCFPEERIDCFFTVPTTF